MKRCWDLDPKNFGIARTVFGFVERCEFICNNDRQLEEIEEGFGKERDDKWKHDWRNWLQVHGL